MQVMVHPIEQNGFQPRVQGYLLRPSVPKAADRYGAAD
jgi:hypothetical protein